jgi:recombination protein RecA
MAAQKVKKPLPQVRAKNATEAASAVVDAIRKRYGKASAMVLGDGGSLAEVKEVIPTGIEVVDRYVLGIGGLAVGRISEMYGPEGVGKSSFLAKCIASTQAEGGIAVLAENENALQPSWWEMHGVDLDRLILLEADTIEATTARLYDAISALPTKLEGPCFAAWDTLAATPTKREIDIGLDGNDKVGDRAKALSKAMRLLTRLVARRRCHFMIVNQIRDNIGVMFGDKTSTPGGHAVKFHASIRIQLLGGKAVKEKVDWVDREDQDADDTAGDSESKVIEHAAKDITLLCAKNKLSIPWKKCRLRLDYTKGWDNAWSTFYHAKELGLIEGRDDQDEASLKRVRRRLGWLPPAAVVAPIEDDGEEVPL